MPVTAEMYVEVTSLWVDDQVLGQTFETSISGHRAWLSFPADEHDFRSDEEPPAVTGNYRRIGEHWARRAVQVLRLDLELESDLAASDPDLDGTKALALWEEASGLALPFFSSLRSLARTRFAQPWIEPEHLESQLSWRSRLVDSTGRRFSMGSPIVISPMPPGRVPVGRTEIEEITALAADGEHASLEDGLLADAWFYGFYASHPDRRTAVLFAAFSVERRIKQFLRRCATQEQREIVDYLLRRNRDGVPDLFKGVLKAVTGRSMADDDPATFKAVKDLFEIRGRIAHGGPVETNEISRWLRAAEDVVRYLVELEEDHLREQRR